MLLNKMFDKIWMCLSNELSRKTFEEQIMRSSDQISLIIFILPFLPFNQTFLLPESRSTFSLGNFWLALNRFNATLISYSVAIRTTVGTRLYSIFAIETPRLLQESPSSARPRSYGFFSSHDQVPLYTSRMTSSQQSDHKIEVLAPLLGFDFRKTYRSEREEKRESRIIHPRMPTSAPTRPLGRDGPEIPALGLGLMGLSSEPSTGEYLALGED